jgi:hypothetical protein
MPHKEPRAAIFFEISFPAINLIPHPEAGSSCLSKKSHEAGKSLLPPGKIISVNFNNSAKPAPGPFELSGGIFPGELAGLPH